MLSQTTEEPLYCPEQIKIPPNLPNILKEFTKSAIRTQPKDLVKWSHGYFQALAAGERPPVKERFEIPTKEAKKGKLTKGTLQVLHKQLGSSNVVKKEQLTEKWNHLGLDSEQLIELLSLGDFEEEFDWLKFLSLSCSSLENNIISAMVFICEILTSCPEGGAAQIPLDTFLNLYNYLAEIDGEIAKERMENVTSYLKEAAGRQDGLIGPANFQHKDCPRLGGD
ncbi:ropporin-1-like protein [Oscarella lobularis]|uniref:ropporin-1-like protein n=1 Tax=Oscarella lobularis TaxID=121494 RepID=UPI0033135ACA